MSTLKKILIIIPILSILFTLENTYSKKKSAAFNFINSCKPLNLQSTRADTKSPNSKIKFKISGSSYHDNDGLLSLDASFAALSEKYNKLFMKKDGKYNSEGKSNYKTSRLNKLVGDMFSLPSGEKISAQKLLTTNIKTIIAKLKKNDPDSKIATKSIVFFNEVIKYINEQPLTWEDISTIEATIDGYLLDNNLFSSNTKNPFRSEGNKSHLFNIPLYTEYNEYSGELNPGLIYTDTNLGCQVNTISKNTFLRSLYTSNLKIQAPSTSSKTKGESKPSNAR